MDNPNWNPIKRPLYRWVPTIERIVSAEQLPRMDGPVINVFSDYSGAHKASSYNVISVLCIDLAASAYLEKERRGIRKRFMADGRRMAFKNLSDRQRKAALIPFLEFANQLEGICVTMAIRKSIQNLCIDSQGLDLFRDHLKLKGSWTTESFERMLRIVNLIAFLLGGLSKPKQHVYWISDEDELFANPDITADLQMMIGRYTSLYVSHDLGELGLGTTKIDEGDRFEEDFAAIPDLLAGAIAEVITKVATVSGGSMPASGIAVQYPRSFSAKTELLCSWLSDNGQPLKRLVILFERQNQGAYSVSKFNLS